MSDAKFQVVITDLGYPGYEPEEKELAQVGAELIRTECSTVEEVAAACRQADGVLTRLAPVRAAAIEQMQKCRVISRYGVGVDNVDVQAATARGIVVANVRDYCNEDVSDHALALLLSCVRKTVRRDKQVRAGEWDIGSDDPVWRIAGKTLGLVGFGAIARTLLRKVGGFGLDQVLAFDPYVDDKEIARTGARKVELDELLARSDFVSVHAPLTDETHHLIGARQFERMKPTAVLVNTSRGGLVDPDALYEALKSGAINSAGIDVYEPEPPAGDCKLFELDNIVLTDHTGWYSEESQRTLQESTARNAALVLTGKEPLFCVNPEVLK